MTFNNQKANKSFWISGFLFNEKKSISPSVYKLSAGSLSFSESHIHASSNTSDLYSSSDASLQREDHSHLLLDVFTWNHLNQNSWLSYWIFHLISLFQRISGQTTQLPKSKPLHFSLHSCLCPSHTGDLKQALPSFLPFFHSNVPLPLSYTLAEPRSFGIHFPNSSHERQPCSLSSILSVLGFCRK